MKKECKKFIKKIKQLDEGDCVSFYDYEFVCLTPKNSFMVIYYDDMNMEELSFEELINFIENKW